MYKLPQLPYAFDVLEPHIDAQTMEIHHGKHHATYVSKLNDASASTEWADLDPAVLLRKISATTPAAIRNNGGGHYNHSLFWSTLTGAGKQEPSGELLTKIDQAFGSFTAFQEQFATAATTRFGSGWAWLCADNDGNLSVGSTPNQDNPLMPVSAYRGHPLLGLDVWEHAYYLRYQNRRPEYIQAFWNIVDWQAVAARLSL